MTPVAEDRYIKCDPKSPCQLALADPRPGAATAPAHWQDHATTPSASLASGSLPDRMLSFREGDIVVFPSWLTHYVPPSDHVNQNEPRISVSFNAVVKLLPDSTSDGQMQADENEEDGCGAWSVRFTS